MNIRHSFVDKTTVDWLLEPENPSVRFLTLTELLGKPVSDPEVSAARSDIMTKGTVPEILKHQKEEGFWGTGKDFYTAKYKGTVWQLMILAELEADGNNEAIRKACEFILSHSRDRESGGFSYQESVKTGGGRHSGVIPCLTGNVLWFLLKFGYFDNPRIEKTIAFVNTFQRFDDGEDAAPAGWPYEPYEMCWGRHTCHMGVVKVLKALALIPQDRRSAETRQTIKRATEFLLIHHIFKKSHNLFQKAKPGWLKLGFPLMYQTDILEILLILTGLMYKDSRMQEAVEILISKRNDNGRWVLENSFNGRMITDIEEKGKESKWITLNALRVLKAFAE
jgi:hypothetical protein